MEIKVSEQLLLMQTRKMFGCCWVGEGSLKLGSYPPPEAVRFVHVVTDAT